MGPGKVRSNIGMTTRSVELSLIRSPLKGGGRGRSDQQERNYVKHNSYAGDALPNPRQYGRESLGDRDRGLAYWLEGGGCAACSRVMPPTTPGSVGRCGHKGEHPVLR